MTDADQHPTSTPPSAGILHQPHVWRLLNYLRHQPAGWTAEAAATWSGVDYLTLAALTRGDTPLLQFVDRWNPNRPAPIAVTGPDHLTHVGIRLTPTGLAWLANSTENMALRQVASHGGTIHLSTLAGVIGAAGLDEALARLITAGAVTVKHTNIPQPLTVDEITPELLNQPRKITLTLTVLGAAIAGRP